MLTEILKLEKLYIPMNILMEFGVMILELVNLMQQKNLD